jgi:hypothetical protein
MTSHAKRAKLAELQEYKIDRLFHLTHLDNLPGILRRGILPQSRLQTDALPYTDISEPTVQQRREKILNVCSVERRVHELVPLFFVPKTPMLSCRRKLSNDICFVVVAGEYLSADEIECVICDGNAASAPTGFWLFRPGCNVLSNVPWDTLNAATWFDRIDGKRERSAEVLVWPSIPANAFVEIAVKSWIVQQRVAAIVAAAKSTVPWIVRKDYFF